MIINVMKLVIFPILYVFLLCPLFSFAEYKFSKSIDFCQEKELKNIESIRLSKITGMDQWKFVSGKGKKGEESFNIEAYEKKVKVATLKDPFQLESCQCGEKAEERTISCFVEWSPFRLEKDNVGLLMRVAQGGEAVSYNYHLFDLKNKKLVSLWEAQYGTGEIMSIYNSVLELVDRDKNGQDEILYSDTKNYSSSPYPDQLDDVEFTYKEYDSKSKKLKDKKPFVVYAVKLKELVNHKVAMAFHKNLSCDKEKILIVEKNKKFKALTNAQRVVVQFTTDEEEAKKLKKDLKACGNGVKPEIVKLEL